MSQRWDGLENLELAEQVDARIETEQQSDRPEESGKLTLEMVQNFEAAHSATIRNQRGEAEEAVSLQVVALIGSGGEDRTPDLGIMRPSLYH